MHVLVTRIEPAASRLAEGLRADGHRVDTWPALTIAPLDVPPAVLAAARQADAWLFVSVPSVDLGWPLLAPTNAPTCYAVGPATAAALRALGVAPELAPGSGAAEQLLTLPSLQHLHGRHLAVVRGRDGLDTLPTTLAARGARVTLLEPYARLPLSPAQLCAAWHAPQCVVASSGDGVRALKAAADGADEAGHDESTVAAASLGAALRAAMLLVPSARVAALARSLGFTQVTTCDGADDAAVRAALRGR